MLPPEEVRRYPRSLTDEALEREILSSTPKGDVAGRELLLDFSELGKADFHAVGRLIGASEGFIRRGGSLRIVLPSTRATAEEAQRLAVPTTRNTHPAVRKAQTDLARLVQDRSRASRFLQRVGFLEAANCTHLVDAVVAVDSLPPLASEREPAEVRVRPSPLVDQGPLLEVVPFQWLPMATEEEFAAVVKHTDSVLTRMGVDRRVRQAVHELAQNVREHSLHGDEALTSVGSQHMLFGVATRRNGKETLLEILVVDGGVGIPATLGRDFRSFFGRTGTQSEIVAHAFQANSTRKQKSQVEGSARGLAVVLSAVRNAGGMMSVRSGTGEVLLRDGELVTGDVRPGFQSGTAFSLSIPFHRARYRHSIGLDEDIIEPSTLDVDAYIVHKDGTSQLLVSLGASTRPAQKESTVIFVEPGCTRLDLEHSLDRHVVPNGIVIAASTDGQGALLRDQIEAILAARSSNPGAEVLVLDGLEPVLVQGTITPRTVRGLVRSVIERFSEVLAQAMKLVVDQTAITPRRTWSLEVAAQWIEPRQFTDVPVVRVLSPIVLAFRAAQQIAESAEHDLTVLDVIVTDNEFAFAADAVAGWLGARHVRRIRVPQEPDNALLVDEIEAASVVLTPVIHGGGATIPIIRGLLASGRRSITVCCLIDSRRKPVPDIEVAGHLVPLVAAITSSSRPPAKAVAALETDALEQLRFVLEGAGRDADVYAAIAASPGSLSLGHFHSENRAWMSAVIAPAAIADPTTAIGRLIVERLAIAIREEVETVCPGAVLEVRDLAEPTLLTQHVRNALHDVRDGTGESALATVLVDWGALTGETVVRGALATAREGSDAVIVAVGVDRAFRGAHHLLRRSSMTMELAPRGQLPGTAALEKRQVIISFVRAVDFPRDHRSEIDCPLCATERSLLRVRSMPTTLLNNRLRTLRVRMSSDPPRTETVDAFDCEMSADDVRGFLVWRSILHRGTGDRGLAHGVALRLEGGDGGLPSPDLISLARNLVLNPDLLRRRPWSSPRFRHALALAIGHFLRSNNGLAISSSMARQLVIVLRMSSKSTFARLSGPIHSHWRSPDVREEIEVSLATMLRDNMSGSLLATVTTAVTEFEAALIPEEKSTSLGALKSDIVKVRSSRQGDEVRQFRWREAAKMLAALPTHMGLGGATGRLPILLANLLEPEVSARDTLIDSAVRHLHEIQRFIEIDFPSVRTLVEDEFEPLVQRGAADQFPNQDEWMGAARQLDVVIEELRSATGGSKSDVQRLMDSVLSPLSTSPDSKSFASVVLSAVADLGQAVDAVRVQFEPNTCTVVGPDRTANVLFPRMPLHDLLAHLVENGAKHRRPDAPPPQIRFELLSSDEDPVHRRLRVAYRDTASQHPPNSKGGLSGDQWGGAIAAFGGKIDVLPVIGSDESSFVLELHFQRPWGDTS